MPPKFELAAHQDLTPPPFAPSRQLEAGPLATAVVLTCNRPQWALLAAEQIARQDHRPLEVLVVDDGSSPVEALLRNKFPALEVVGPEDVPATTPALAGSGLLVRLLVLPRHVTIGEKRSVATRAARGEVVLH